MPAPARPQLSPGRVYRTRELSRWGRNPTRLASRLVREGVLRPLAKGLYLHPKVGRFGPVPPTDEELMRAFLDGGRFVFSGPEVWNTLGLGSTAAFSARLVYNEKRSGTFTFAGRRFLLRRVRFPRRPTSEWFVVDLLEHHDSAGVSRERLERNLARALEEGRFGLRALRRAAERYGTKATQALVERAAGEAA